MSKPEARDRAQLVVFAYQNGLVNPDDRLLPNRPDKPTVDAVARVLA